MIDYLKPYFDKEEEQVLQTQIAPAKIKDKDFEKFFLLTPCSSFLLCTSGRAALRELFKILKSKGAKSITIPDVICGTVYQATYGLFEKTYLMDADYSWNWSRFLNEESAKADVLLYANLGGKRAVVPRREIAQQVIINDSAQRWESMFDPGPDYSLISFSAGKQMFANGGAILWSPLQDSLLADMPGFVVPDWQRWLMHSQLQKIEEITTKRIANATKIIEGIKYNDWLVVPDIVNHSFTKLTIFIRQEKTKYFQPGFIARTKELWTFYRYMLDRGIACEETYIPLHQRFPQDFDPNYCFDCDHTWVEAINIPCRPNLTEWDVERIIECINEYQEMRVEVIPPIPRKENPLGGQSQKETFDRHGAAQPVIAEGGYFRELYEIRMNIIRSWGKDVVIGDLGCGTGNMLIPLVHEGYNVEGVDFSDVSLDGLRAALLSNGLEAKVSVSDLTNLVNYSDNYFDAIYCCSTLYHIEDVAKTISEIARVLKPGGKALLEFGNLNSLNQFECTRDSNAAKCYMLTMEQITTLLMENKLSPRDWRCFQLFPLYGNSVVNITLRHILERKIDGTMIDELLSGSIFARNFAFRQMFVVEKTKQYEALRIDMRIEPKEWLDESRIALRTQAQEALIGRNIDIAMQIYGRLLASDPTDMLTILDMMEMYQSPEERQFVMSVRQMVGEQLRQEFKQTENKETKAITTSKSALGSSSTGLVSIVLPTYNQVDFLQTAIRSILEQSVDTWELIIVDDCSTDGTKELLQGITHKRIKKIRHEYNKRLPSALNTGFAQAQGEFFTWISSDCWCHPHFLATLLGALHAFPAAGMAYSDFFLVDEAGAICGRISNPIYNQRTLLIRNDGNASFLYRREVAKVIGGYDEQLEGAEDWDYWIRMSAHYEFAYVPESLYYYRLHKSSMQNTKHAIVNDSIRTMLAKLYGYSGGRLDMSNLYAVKYCEDIPRAMAVACLHFALQQENRARMKMPGFAEQFLHRANMYPGLYTINPNAMEETEELFKQERVRRMIFHCDFKAWGGE